jgi:hypothetical protein
MRLPDMADAMRLAPELETRVRAAVITPGPAFLNDLAFDRLLTY